MLASSDSASSSWSSSLSPFPSFSPSPSSFFTPCPVAASLFAFSAAFFFPRFSQVELLSRFLLRRFLLSLFVSKFISCFALFTTTWQIYGPRRTCVFAILSGKHITLLAHLLSSLPIFLYLLLGGDASLLDISVEDISRQNHQLVGVLCEARLIW